MRRPERCADRSAECRLEPADVERLRGYFGQVEHLRRWLGYIVFRVGGRDHTVDADRGHRRGVTFAVPRQSLMAAVEWQAFDDLLIGNFMRTTLHGGARSAAELRAYFAAYGVRGFTSFDLGPADREMQRALQPYLA